MLKRIKWTTEQFSAVAIFPTGMLAFIQNNKDKSHDTPEQIYISWL